jgi:hypothetical protein
MSIPAPLKMTIDLVAQRATFQQHRTTTLTERFAPHRKATVIKAVKADASTSYGHRNEVLEEGAHNFLIED